MLDPAEARGPVESTPNDRRNPLVELPEPAEAIAARAEVVLVTHLHADHLDDTAVALLAGDRPVLAQPPDAETLRERGFSDVRPVEDALELDGIHVARTGGQHGTGEIARMLAPVSGYVLRAEGEPTVYIAGDTIWCDEVRAAIDEHAPDVIVVNASGARFIEGDPIVMTAEDVATVARHAPGARSSPSTWRRSTTASSRAAPCATCRSACPRTAPRCRRQARADKPREPFLAHRSLDLAGQPGSRHRSLVSVGLSTLGKGRHERSPRRRRRLGRRTRPVALGTRWRTASTTTRWRTRCRSITSPTSRTSRPLRTGRPPVTPRRPLRR